MAQNSFPLFSQLPLELRLQIWHHALPPPSQVYELSMYAANFYAAAALDDEIDEWALPEGYLGDLWNILQIPRRSTPGIYQTCQEARRLSRRHYIAHERGWELNDTSLIPYVEKQQQPVKGDATLDVIFHHQVPHPTTSRRKSHILCSSDDLIHFLPFDDRLRDGTEFSTRIISDDELVQRFEGIRYLAISLPDLDGWLWQCPRSRLYFSQVDVLFVLRKETECSENYSINWDNYPKRVKNYSGQATDSNPIAAKSTMFVETLEAAVLEIEKIVTRQEGS
ncbi:hypothetical protein GLAREA_00527 [Glarea lozoyensis ATCC 20868]|uniref:2EXR domain-containing protein n=1 Tax=Glarea lozoyensis (strain ATCC 20868 / MF5171) TaxID=1116229 RepID=S3CSG5_GLAL2|nr:uncharacterized protein GLAREA_00527 [Glarea lozoyensis ATCC 20868]EPE29367.1 hypothetical protein GLAREA_00527 [Glarea lozoyensis ATCC 20868]